ncbi:MAG: NAD(P)-dependent oxidoreductase [Gammaproteobacteria bacterium]|nr:NAD(P)-dependent oxidoreductase [Gammaproteobacteria bacterium]
MSRLQQRTVFITGASRGIGRAMALACAREGAQVVIAAKSAEPHPKLPGTIYSVAQEIEAAGGQALPLVLDVRDETAVARAMQQAAAHFGGIDMLVNNAGAIRLQGVEHLPVKRYDLLQQINARAVFVCSQAALPWLKKSDQAHILSLSPPLNLDPRWFAQYGPYTISKYGMSMLSIGMAVEFKRYGIRVNTLWPQTLIATAAVEMEGGAQALQHARTPEIMADAAVAILARQDPAFTGQHLIDEAVLREQGVTDFAPYRHQPGDTALVNDLFLD